MQQKFISNILKKKDYIIKPFIFELVKSQNLDLNDTLLLIFLTNQEKPILDISLIKETIFLSEIEIMTSFSNLSSKNLIKTDVVKKDDKIEEYINIDNIYNLAFMDIEKEVKNTEKQDIFSIFEQEFGRTLSPMECELINAWINCGINEELVIGALKEATYNGVNNLRYIDKIIYEWGKKGFKTMDDVNKHLKNKEKKDYTDDGFDYNWLDGNE